MMCKFTGAIGATQVMSLKGGDKSNKARRPQAWGQVFQASDEQGEFPGCDWHCGACAAEHPAHCGWILSAVCISK